MCAIWPSSLPRMYTTSLRESGQKSARCCPDITQEGRMSRVARNRLAHVSGMVVWTTTEVLLHEYGPHAEIWLQHIPQCGQERQPGALLRRMIFARVSEHMMH